MKLWILCAVDNIDDLKTIIPDLGESVPFSENVVEFPKVELTPEDFEALIPHWGTYIWGQPPER